MKTSRKINPFWEHVKNFFGWAVAIIGYLSLLILCVLFGLAVGQGNTMLGALVTGGSFYYIANLIKRK